MYTMYLFYFHSVASEAVSVKIYFYEKQYQTRLKNV